MMSYVTAESGSNRAPAPVSAMKTTSLTPLDVFEEACQAIGDWHLLHTRSRQEKALVEGLAARGIACFLPLVDVTRTYGRRKVAAELPLFPGYVFLKGELNEVYEADRTKRVANIIRVTDQDKITWELRNLAMSLAATIKMDPYPYLRTGVRVEVRSGPLQGVQGVIENRTRRDRLILQVDVLGQATSVEIDGAILDLID